MFKNSNLSSLGSLSAGSHRSLFKVAFTSILKSVSLKVLTNSLLVLHNCSRFVEIMLAILLDDSIVSLAFIHGRLLHFRNPLGTHIVVILHGYSRGVLQIFRVLRS